MRILIIGLNYSPELVGVGPYTTDLAQFLNQRGHHVHVLAGPPYYPQWRRTPHTDLPDATSHNAKASIHVTRCPVWIPRTPSGARRLLHLTSFGLSVLPVALAVSRRFRPDRVLAIAPTLTSAPTALLVAQMVHAPTWLHLHDLEWHLASRLGFLGQTGGRWAATIGSRLVRAFDGISTLSAPMAATLAHHGVTVAQHHIFPNWVDMDQFRPDPAARLRLRQRLGLAPQSLVVLFCGSMGAKQHLPGLIHLAARYRDQPLLQFALCGDGPIKQQLESTVQAMGLRNVVFGPLFSAEEFPGMLPGADVHYAVQNSGVATACLPSKIGPILACGGRLLASSELATAAPDLVQNAEDAISLAHTSHDDIACALNRILAQDTTSPSDSARFAANRLLSKDVVLKKFEEALMKGVNV
ncbi:WcaI family glycosyltransferase [Desulfovibrio inopinatus]|uniref:WcaI family glycosyltransferase n=1 Tax=Desulfovibrio inopinatus TaxID=102109 RepID=UPI00041B997E|nr:WcaI family glycosyltransferase [Desulfovibrio inopinatus]